MNASPSDTSTSNNLAVRLSLGYRRLGTFLGITLAVALFAVAVSLAIVLPLWLIATRFPALYSGIIGVSLGALLLFLLVRAIRADRARRLRTVIRRGALLFAAVAAGYLAAALIAAGYLLAGIPAAVVVLLAIGFFCGSPGR